MAPDRNSGKLWRRLATSCVIAAVVIAPWSRLIAPVLAGLGVAVGAPHWFKRSWGELLDFFRPAASRSGGANVPPFSPEQETGIEKLRGAGRLGPAGGALGRRREASSKAVSNPEYSFDTWRFHVQTEKSPEPVLLPQNAIRLAANSASTGSSHKKPPAGTGSKEVIDHESILEDFGKRYRSKRPVPPVEKNPQPSRLRLTKEDMEEVRRRLAAANGRRLSGSVRQTSADQNGDRERRAPVPGASRSDPGVFPEALVIPAWSTVVEQKRAGHAPEEREAARRPHGGEQSAAGRASSPPQAQTPGKIPENPGPFAKPGPLFSPAASSAQRPHEDESGYRIKGLSLETPVSEPLGAKPEVATVSPDKTGAESNPFGPECDYDFCLPPASLLHPADSAIAPVSQDDLIDGGILIEEKLAEFRVKVNVQDAYAGPVITRYEVQPAVGVRGGQVVSLMKDLARALSLASIRVVETIPGKTCMGLELPNARRQMIRLSEVLSSEVFRSHRSKLAMALGKDIIGEPVVVDLAKAPHMLVAGTTGSGKSVGLNAMILSLLYRVTPAEVRFVMIDPKMLELSIYDGIPHLLAPVVTDMKLAANALNWCVREMERRYRLMNSLHVRNLDGYNQKVLDGVVAGELPAEPSAEDQAPLSPLPYIVVVVDELADLMMTAGKKIEELIARLAQKARAAGIHLIVATQRPSVDVITGLIKANIPTRIAFQVSSRIDSRTILDQMGAECLLGQGDMLYLPPGSGYPLRVHGAFVADEEVQAVAEYLKGFGEPHYLEEVLNGPEEAGDEAPSDADRFGDEADPLYDDAVAFVLNSRRASISAVQRHLRIGYNRAARIIEQMEASGLVSPMESNGNRTVLASTRQE